MVKELGEDVGFLGRLGGLGMVRELGDGVGAK